MSGTLIRELLGEIEANLRLLEEFQDVPREEFVTDPHKHLLAERCFQLAIQCVIDTCQYIASRKRWQRPADSAEAILLMGRRRRPPGEFARRIVGMANFRNILVHAYLGINRSIVYEFLSRLDDFRQFVAFIEDFLDREEA